MATKLWKEDNAEKMRKYRRDYYYKNKESHYTRNKKTLDQIKEYVNDIKKEGCIICREKEISCMDFHHLRDKTDVVARIIKKGSLNKVKEEIDKCVVVCANCHRKIHAGVIVLDTGQLKEASGLQNLE